MFTATLLALALQQPKFDQAIIVSRKAMLSMVDEQRAPGGAIAVAVDGKIVWKEGFGNADLESKTRIDTETLFGIGSISKSLTMTCVARLVDKGLLDWDAPIETYLPDFPFRGKNISLRAIGSHQSGLSDTFAAGAYWTMDKYSIDSAYQELKKEKVVYEPRTETRYATGLFGIVAKVIEKVSGKPYLQVMHEEVFKPTGMKRTIVSDPRNIIENRTRFYLGATGGGFEHAPSYDPSHKLAGAGFLSTARDLAMFGSALFRNEYISEKTRNELWRPMPLQDGKETPFAQGFQFADDEGRPLAHQPGGGPGISAWLYVYPEQKLVIAITTNVPTGPAGGKAYSVTSEQFLRVIERQQHGR